VARLMYEVDALVQVVLRDGRKPGWIDLSPEQRALAISTMGGPAGAAAPLRVALWHDLLDSLQKRVELV
jgi:hypothetical protein